jgi:type IV pilus assembly protein PilY1
MVYFGTGRLFNSADKATAGQQRIFGLIDTALLPAGDAQATTQINFSTLINVTGISVDGTDPVAQKVTGLPTNSLLNNVTSFPGLAAAFNSPGIAGWYRNLTTSGTNPSERVVSSQALLGGLLLTAAYTPGTSICTGLGNSVLYGQNFETGTGDPGGFFGNDASGNVNVSTSLGAGLPAPPSLHTGNGSDTSGGKTVTACTQTSTGAIVCKDVATLKPVTSGESSWREPLGK